jgi:hypothetical protein
MIRDTPRPADDHRVKTLIDAPDVDADLALDLLAIASGHHDVAGRVGEEVRRASTRMHLTLGAVAALLAAYDCSLFLR